MTSFRHPLRLACATLAALALSACHGPETDPVIPAGLVVTVAVAPPAPTMLIGDTIRFTAAPLDAKSDTVTSGIVTATHWATSDTLVATVSTTGLVTGVAVGLATISALINGITGSALVSVTAVNLNLPYSAISAGQTHTCSLTTAGAAYCWGDNAAGELGVIITSAPTIPGAVAGGLTFTSVSAGGFHSCALTAAGAAYCWGDNSYGELGANSPLASASTPLAVAGGLTFKALSVGGLHTCALTTANIAYCWGDNAQGQLGTGNTASASAPVPVMGGMTFSVISAGLEHTCALTTAGVPLCWGDLNTQPSVVPGGFLFAAISAGNNHNCALTAAGAAFCWGDNLFGELGNGSSAISSATPVAVSGGLVFSSISAGTAHSCGLVGGAGYCWGNNANGELGTGTSVVASSTPLAVAGGLTFTSISAGQLHSCGVTPTGNGYCWGNNQYGQLGNGTLVGSLVPIRS